MQIRLNSWREANEKFLKLLRHLENEGALKVIHESDPYANRGKSVCERIYVEVSLNPEFKENQCKETIEDILYRFKGFLKGYFYKEPEALTDVLTALDSFIKYLAEVEHE